MKFKTYRLTVSMLFSNSWSNWPTQFEVYRKAGRFEYVLSTMGVSKTSTSEFLIWNRFHVSSVLKIAIKAYVWEVGRLKQGQIKQTNSRLIITQHQNILTNGLMSRITSCDKRICDL